MFLELLINNNKVCVCVCVCVKQWLVEHEIILLNGSYFEMSN